MTHPNDQPRPDTRRAERFESVLFERPPDLDSVEAVAEPDFFSDLNLDQLVATLTSSREEYRLGPFLHLAPRDVDAIAYRHEVFRDLERPEVRSAVAAFAASMHTVRGHLEQREKLHDDRQRQAYLRDAIELYCSAVRTLAGELDRLEPRSRGLGGLAGHLADYVAGESFTTLDAETADLKEALDGIEYAVHIDGGRVSVEKPDGQPDYSAVVERTFERFARDAARSHLVRVFDLVEMNQVESRILALVARLYPTVFGRLASYCERHRDFLDPTVARFDREVQVYLAYLELVDRLRGAGLAFCYPRVSARSKETEVVATFDVVLAYKLVAEREGVVCNDVRLQEPERVFVVTGPNNGGKTTFARMVGQLHHLAALGFPVPGSSARLFLPDRIFTHFERVEEIETLRGKFDDELVRVHAILEQATGRSLIVMNESFNSTTLEDARLVGEAVLRRILELGALAVYVTCVDELASLSEATVSVVSQVVPDNPAERTYKVVRTAPDGLAYAWAIAEKYGLTYDRLIETIPS